MPLNPDNLARRIVRDLALYTNGKAMQWVPIQTIARRLVVNDAAAVDRALAFAEDNDWLLLEGGHSICLTDAGRRLTTTD